MTRLSEQIGSVAVLGRLAVVGLGYIGVPTAIAFARSGWNVVGVDIDRGTYESIGNGLLPFHEPGLETALKLAIASGNLTTQASPPFADVFVISVPTPLSKTMGADLTHVFGAIESIIPKLRRGNTVILESTSPPGTTKKIAQMIFSSRPELLGANGDGIFVAYAPERVLPGNILLEFAAIDRIVGGVTRIAGEKAKEIYESFSTGNVQITDAATAEVAKLAENAYRDINIAFANELSIISETLDTNVWEIISLANRHPRVNILSPGAGVGGHCIAVDPWFLAAADRENSNLIQLARKINNDKQTVVESRANDVIRKLSGVNQRVAILGLTFKPNVDDLRGSPAMEISTNLVRENPQIVFDILEPHLEKLPDQLNGFTNVSLADSSSFNPACTDLVVVLVRHSKFEQFVDQLRMHSTVIDPCGLTADCS